MDYHLITCCSVIFVVSRSDAQIVITAEKAKNQKWKTSGQSRNPEEAKKNCTTITEATQNYWQLASP